MADELKARFMKRLKAQRVHPQIIATELHDYDYQKKNFKPFTIENKPEAI